MLKKELIREFRKSVVFLGRNRGNTTHIIGTGFLMQIDGINHLVTAKHVVARKDGSLDDEGIVLFFNLVSGTKGFRTLEATKTRFGVNWIFHQDAKIDVAMIPIGIDTNTDDVAVIPNDMILKQESLAEGYDVFFFSFQPQIPIGQKIVPLVRQGMISLIHTDKTIVMDALVYPGNSGSPVFVTPTLGLDNAINGHFIGVVGAYIPYKEECISLQTEETRIVFEDNTGLAVVYPLNFINDIIGYPEFKTQIERLGKEITGTQAADNSLRS
jgi:hypothetical protein